MALFEFVLEGPPVSLNATKGTPRSRKRYREWIVKVNAAAQSAWPSGVLPTANNAVTVTVSCYHREEPPDVYNILKPICDGMKGVVYVDDKQVWRVISQRFDRWTTAIDDPSDVLAGAIGEFTEIVHVIVTWD